MAGTEPEPVLLAIVLLTRNMGVPKMRDNFLGDPIMRTIVYWGLYRGALTFGNYHI